MIGVRNWKILSVYVLVLLLGSNQAGAVKKQDLRQGSGSAYGDGSDADSELSYEPATPPPPESASVDDGSDKKTDSTDAHALDGMLAYYQKNQDSSPEGKQAILDFTSYVTVMKESATQTK